MFGNVSAAYIGCFKDLTNSRDLPYRVPITTTSIESCVNVCEQQSYCYMGLQNGWQRIIS